MRFYARLERTDVWSHVRVRSAELSDTLTKEIDVRIIDQDQQIIAEFLGMRWRRIIPDTSFGNTTAGDLSFYQVVWKPEQDPIDISRSLEDTKWLILTQRNKTAKKIQSLLNARGNHCQMLQLDDDRHSGTDPSWRRAVTDGDYHEILFVWDPEDLSVENTSIDGCQYLVKIIQLLAAKQSMVPTHLRVITFGAQAVTREDPISVSQSPLWGLANVVNFEHPHLHCTCIDLDRNTDEDFQLTWALFAENHERKLAIRGKQRYVPRLVPYAFNALTPHKRTVHSDGTYFITGGSGGLGLVVARWLVRNGAKHLVLISRSELSASNSGVVDELRHVCRDIQTMKVDVTIKEELDECIARISQEMPPLRGVIHAAGVLQDGAIVNLTPERVAQVMAPKVIGAWNVHKATELRDLDFFVLFSSAVSVLGSPGQGNYAAANAFLDALAHYRRHQGLPAVSVNWGPWADVGMAAALHKKDPLTWQPAHMGVVKSIAVDQGVRVLERLILEEVPQVVVLPFDVHNLIELSPTAMEMPFFAEVAMNSRFSLHVHERPELHKPYASPQTQVERRLAEIWQQTLHIDQVGTHDTFFELGGDSVLAAEILALTQKHFGISLNFPQSLDEFTIEKIAVLIEERILARVEGLSDEETQQLLHYLGNSEKEGK